MIEQDISERTSRRRPRWACRIHDLGDDLRWALGAWCDFPRPLRRAFAASIALAGGRMAGVDEFVGVITQRLTE